MITNRSDPGLIESSSPDDCNVPSGVSGKRMRIIVNLAGGSNIATGNIPLAGGDAGEGVALDCFNAVCTGARSGGFTCSGALTGPFQICDDGAGANPDCCGAGVATSRGAIVTCTNTGGRGFDLNRSAGDDGR